MNRFLFALTLFGCCFCVQASQENLNDTLVRIINQINAIKPLLDEAENQISPDNRIQLHINAFTTADGKHHNGLREDLLTIRDALIQYINQPVSEPAAISPMEFDFVRVKP